MKCNKCQNINMDGASYCCHCGAPLTSNGKETLSDLKLVSPYIKMPKLNSAWLIFLWCSPIILYLWIGIWGQILESIRYDFFRDNKRLVIFLIIVIICGVTIIFLLCRKLWRGRHNLPKWCKYYSSNQGRNGYITYVGLNNKLGTYSSLTLKSVIPPEYDWIKYEKSCKLFKVMKEGKIYYINKDNIPVDL